VAELVDAADSKSAVRKGVKVRFLSWAQAPAFIAGAFLLQLLNSSVHKGVKGGKFCKHVLMPATGNSSLGTGKLV
jgi:ribosomal protein S12